MSSNHKDQILSELDEANLTAYALGQLVGRELAEVETLLLRSEKARQYVKETSRFAGEVREACQSCPMPEPSATLREALEIELQKTSISQVGSRTMTAMNRKRSLKKYLIGFTIVGGTLAVLIALLLPAMQGAREAARRIPDSDKRPGELIYSNEKAAASPRKEDAVYNTGKPIYETKGGDKEVAYTVCKPEYEKRQSNTKYTGPGRGMGHGKTKPVNSAGKPADYDNLSPIAVPSGLDAAYSNASTPSGYGGQLDGKEGKFVKELSNVDKSSIPYDSNNPYGMPDAREWDRLSKTHRTWPGNGDKQSGEKQSGDKQSEPERNTQLSARDANPISNTEQYDPIIENSFLPVSKEPLSTFSIDVDTASYANVRRFLREGRMPPPNAVRIEEMVNYFPYHYSPPTDGTPFAVSMETAECPWETKHRLLRIGLKGREIERKNRGASNLVFLLDVSGSMNEANKLPLVKEAMKMLVGQLQEDDRVAIVTYASDTNVALPSARGNEREKITAAIDALHAGGCTYGSGGIQLAYQQAVDHFVPGGVNRVILCTDGDLNVGITSDEDLVKLIQEKAKSGVFLTVLGFGEGNLKDSKMQKLADKGNGIYAYIDSMREAHRMLVEQMTGSLMTIAKDVKIQIEFNPAAVSAYRLVGYEKRILANQDFNDDKKDAGEIGAGHTVTALYELVPVGAEESGEGVEGGLKYQHVPQEKLTPQAESGELLTLKIRYKEPEKEVSKLLEFTAKDSGKRFGEATCDFRFAASVAAFGMKLRSSPYCGNLNYAAVAEFAAGALDDDKNGYRAEFLDLVREANRISAGSPQ